LPQGTSGHMDPAGAQVGATEHGGVGGDCPMETDHGPEGAGREPHGGHVGPTWMRGGGRPALADEALGAARASDCARVQQLLSYRASWWRVAQFGNGLNRQPEPEILSAFAAKVVVAAFILGPDDLCTTAAAENVREAARSHTESCEEAIDKPLDSQPEAAQPGERDERRTGHAEVVARMEEGLGFAGASLIQHFRRVFDAEAQEGGLESGKDADMPDVFVSAEFGAVRNLPELWWRTFPPRRRKLRLVSQTHT
jgi:hypothetical protein